MVKFFTAHHTYSHSWEDVTCAFLRKYPNPLSNHVLGCDVINRHVDPATGTLVSQRLLKKTNNKPKIAEKFLGKGSSAGYVLEDSIIDSMNKKMTTVTRNISFAKILCVEETCTYTKSPTNPEWTDCTTEARVTCPMWAWSRPIEGVGLERFKNNIHKARDALEYVVKSVVHPERQRLMTIMHAARPSQTARPTAASGDQ